MATDRYRLAAADTRWSAAGASSTLDALVPATLVAESCRHAGQAQVLTLHADAGRFELSWDGWTVVVAPLAVPFPDRQIGSLLDVAPLSAVRVEADALIGAVQRAAHYAGQQGALVLALGDGELRLRGSDPLAGESEEMIKAELVGDHLTRQHQARYLLDALRPYAGQQVLIEIQADLRPTMFTAANPGDRREGDRGEIDRREVELRYLVVPLRMKGGHQSA